MIGIWLYSHYTVEWKDAGMWGKITKEQNFPDELWCFLGGSVFPSTLGDSELFLSFQVQKGYLIVEKSPNASSWQDASADLSAG